MRDNKEAILVTKSVKTTFLAINIVYWLLLLLATIVPDCLYYDSSLEQNGIQILLLIGLMILFPFFGSRINQILQSNKKVKKHDNQTRYSL